VNTDRDVSRYHILRESAHTILAQACPGALLRFDDHVNEDAAEDIPRANYAALDWIDHAQFKDVLSRIRDAMEYFFDADKPHFAAWQRVYNVDGKWFGGSLGIGLPLGGCAVLSEYNTPCPC